MDKETTKAVVIVPEPMNVLEGRKVIVLMATYNGAQFVVEQIRSIQAQTFKNWQMFVRDDCSQDGTIEKITQLADDDRRIHLLRDTRGPLGVIGNFSALMERAVAENADYVFFSDQDDVWMPGKIGTLLAAITQLEAKYGTEFPVLAHCDMAVVDDQLQKIADSFISYSELCPKDADLGVLLCQNQVTGCASGVNRALLRVACPVPLEVLMHDWWLALIASTVGRVAYIPKVLVSYRQHGGNVLGAVSQLGRILRLLRSTTEWERLTKTIRRSFFQAALLKERISSRGMSVSAENLSQILVYSNILQVSRFKRARTLSKKYIGKSSNRKRLAFNTILLRL